MVSLKNAVKIILSGKNTIGKHFYEEVIQSSKLVSTGKEGILKTG